MDDYGGDNPFDTKPSLPTKTDPHLLSRAEELLKKEEELNRRERNLDQRGQILVDREEKYKNKKPPNWPICRPIVYQNIEEEMPTVELKRLVKIGYTGWFVACVGALYNVVALCAAMAVTGDGTSIGNFILSIVYIFLLVPIWFLIYRLLYRASRKQKPSLFVIFMIMFALETIGFIGFAIGFPQTGAAGFILMTQMLKTKVLVGFIVMGCAIVWSVAAVYAVWVFILARRQYSKAGGLAQAKKEMGAAALDQAKKHPDLVTKAAKMGVQQAAKHPDLIAKGIQSAV